MNVLAKPQLENTILLDELIDIMENLGIPDEGNEMETGVQEMIDEPQDEIVNDAHTENPQTQKQTKTKKGIDISSLSEDSKSLLYNFLIHLEQESMSVANFFESVKYEQMVKTRTKETKVDIVSTEDFFRLLNEQPDIVEGVSITDSVVNELKDLL